MIAGIVISVGIYVIFHLVLGLSLAKGPWGF
jgi:putative tricarboxylic transport membrane protein